jgi:hypothetical protein
MIPLLLGSREPKTGAGGSTGGQECTRLTCSVGGAPASPHCNVTLSESAAGIAETTQAAELVELGSGSATTTRLLLSALADVGTLERYVPIDVTEAAIRRVARALVSEHPRLTVHGVAGRRP